MDVEVARRRKDGSRLHVSMVRVPVAVPDAQVEVYAIYRDITQRKQAAEALREFADRLQYLSRRLLEVQEEERRHLARELHDEFGQIMCAIGLHLQAARALAGEVARARLDKCAAMLDEAVEEVRSLALELRPAMLDTLGLEATLRWLAEQHQQRTGSEVQVAGDLSEAPVSPRPGSVPPSP